MAGAGLIVSGSRVVVAWTDGSTGKILARLGPTAREAFDIGRESPALRDRYGRNSLGQSTLRTLMECSWPGNIRQLENTLRRALVHTHGDILSEEAIEDALRDIPKAVSQSSSSPIKSLDDLEKEHILNALKIARGNRGRVCELLGISRPTLQRKIRKYHIEIE